MLTKLRKSDRLSGASASNYQRVFVHSQAFWSGIFETSKWSQVICLFTPVGHIFYYFCRMENIVTLENTARQVASMLLKIGAIRLNTEKPFKWSSGWNSPIYCDNRLSLSFPDIRTYIKNALADTVRMHFPGAESVAGVATAGIAQGALLADTLNLPYLYVRDKAKGHGMTNMIEGKITPGQKVVVVEDLISTGGSSLKVVDALREAGFEVLGMVAIFTYGFEVARQNFADRNVPLYTLSDYNRMLDEAVKENYVAEKELDSLQQWRLGPETWGN